MSLRDYKVTIYKEVFTEYAVVAESKEEAEDKAISGEYEYEIDSTVRESTVEGCDEMEIKNE